MVFDDNAYLDIHEIKLETALDADPRMPLGCIILHQKNIVAGSDHISGLIFVWSFDTSNKIKFKLIKTLQGHRSNVIALQDLSTCFASCSKDGTLRLWKDFECIYIIPKCHGLDKYPTSLACYHVPGQKTPNLYSGGTDGLIISYDITKGRASNVAAGHSGWILCLACKADTPFLFSGSSDFTVRLWDAVTLQFLYSFEGHSESVYSIGLFENYLVSGDRCGEIRLYDIFTSECLGIFRDYYMINSLQIYKRDGRMRLLSMGQGNFLCEWDTATQEYNCINKYHFGTIRSSMIYENWLFTAARDGAVGVWQLEKADVSESSLDFVEGDAQTGEVFPNLDLYDQWSAVQKAFQELNLKNLKQKNEIFNLRAELFKLKFNDHSGLEPHNSVVEPMDFLDFIHSILDSHMKTASHQLVSSAMLLNEMRIILRNNEDDEIFQTATIDELNLDDGMVDYRLILSDERTIERRDELIQIMNTSAIPVVLSASSCSEISLTYDSDLSDDLESYYGTSNYREHDNIAKLYSSGAALPLAYGSLGSQYNLEIVPAKSDDASLNLNDNLSGHQTEQLYGDLSMVRSSDISDS